MPYFSAKPSTWPCPIIGSPGIVASSVQTPKYLSPLPNWSTAVRSSGLLMKLTKRFSTSGSNSIVSLMTRR